MTFCARDGEVLEETEAGEEMVGRILDGQYEIESFIARGGMGTLYRARHILLGDRVAIKTLKPEMRNNTEWLRRFQREGRAARRFRHPNAVTVYDLRTGADGLTYMVMEYVEGHSLDKELKERGRLTPVEAWRILEPIVGALEAAHAQGVVHRDLKPENVMLSRTNAGELNVKLLDLGIAKLRDVAETHVGEGGTALTMAGQILGTPYYMSPEQWGEPARDGNAEIDGRADIYSLGVILYELTTGAKPYVGYTLGELRQGHVSRRMPLLHTVVEGVPEAFALAVERAMAKDRAERPATAGELAAEVRAALGLASGTYGGLASGIHTTPEPGGTDANRSDAGGGVVPDFESSQTLIRGDAPPTTTPTTSAPHAGAQTTPQVPAPQGAATVVMEQASAHTSGAVATPGAAVSNSTPKMTPLASHTGTADAATKSSSSESSSTESSSSKLVVAGVLLLLVVGLAAGGWFAWKSLRGAGGVEQRSAGGTTKGGGEVEAPARFELMNYWVEAFDDAEQGEGRRVAANALSLPSGQQFKFHFVVRERGYLYIVGPGVGNAPTTFLTARPTGIMKTNLAPAGADFTFPYGEGQVLELDKNPATEEYVVIFSRTPLLAPAFLATEAGHELTPAELKELEDLRARSKTALPSTDVKDSGASNAGGATAAAAPSVTVAVESRGAPAEPVVFDIRIEHR